MKTLFLSASILAFQCYSLLAQNTPITKGGYFEDIVSYDGQIVNLNSLITDETLPSNRPGLGSFLPCSEENTYFKAYYTAGSGFEDNNNPDHLQRREVLCHVLDNLSRFIIPASDNILVRIKVVNINDPANNVQHIDNVLGSAKSFYTYPVYINEIGGIADNVVWKTINSGVDAYSDLFTYGGILPNNPFEPVEGNSYFYHAVLYVNFNDEDGIAEDGDITDVGWNYDVGDVCPDNKMDLYSVLLHEMIHCLGFFSNIQSANSTFLDEYRYFSRYDHFLNTPNGTSSNTGLPIVFAENQPLWMYYNSFNQNILPNVLYPVLNPLFPVEDCVAQSEEPEYTTTNCTNAIKFGGEVDIPVYTPECFQTGSSLSHLDDQCSDDLVTEYEHFLMAIGFGNGITRRFLQDEERDILCALGYKINSHFGFLADGTTDDGVVENNKTYGGVICGGDQVVGIIDGIDELGQYQYLTDGDNILTITGAQLMANDLIFGSDASENSNFRIEGLELIQGTGSIQLSGTDQNGLITDLSTISFDPTAQADDDFFSGIRMLRYIPTMNGIKGNITYVFLKFISVNQTLPSKNYSNPCVGNVCNLIQNGNFEADAEFCSRRMRHSSGLRTSCWQGSIPSSNSNYGFVCNYLTRTDCWMNPQGVCEECLSDFFQPNFASILTTDDLENYPVGIGTFTFTDPPTETYNSMLTEQQNDGLIMIPATLTQISSSPIELSAWSGRIQSQLSAPVIPGGTYKISYWAKTMLFDSSILDCTNFEIEFWCDELPSLIHPEYSSNPRFILANAMIYADNPTTNNNAILSALNYIDTYEWPQILSTQFPNNGLDDYHNILLAQPTAIPGVQANATAEGDWHYRESIVPIPANAPSDLDFIIIDNNVWNLSLQPFVSGFFIDDISLTPYFGDVTDIPASICPGTVLTDLSSFVGNENYVGTFTCSDCPAGTIGVDNNSFDSGVSGLGTFHITYNYSDLNGCSYQDVSVIEVNADACCNLEITIDNITNAACAEIANGGAEITVTNANANTTYTWTGPVTSNVEDPDNLLPGTYTVTVSNGFDCVASVEIMISIIPSTTIPTILSQEMADEYLSNQTLHITGQLTFNTPSEGTIQIDNANLFFDQSNGITVNEASSIGMTNVTLDACSSYWKGIELKANRNNNLIEGQIKGAFFVTMSHSEKGIYSRDLGSNFNTTQALMRSGSASFFNSSFIDNKVAIDIQYGNRWASNGSLVGFLEFINTDFTWTDDVYNRFSNFENSTAKNMVRLFSYNDARFVDCNFDNQTSTNTWSRRGAAIFGFRTNFRMSSSVPGISSSNVNGFKLAIRSEMPTIATMGTSITDVTFEKNQAAIYLNKAMFNRVLRNIIDVGLPTDIPALDNAEVKYEGIAIRAGTGFEISENDITGHILNEGKLTNSDLPYTVGISVISTLSANEEVYRNYMHGLNWAFVANGDNWNEEDGAGLRYVCNENEGNNYDFIVADFPGAPEGVGSSNIGEDQIDFPNASEPVFQNLASGNKFSQENSHNNNDFFNQSQSPAIKYWYEDDIQEQTIESFNSLVQPEPDAPLNLCASEIDLLSNSNRPIWLTIRDSYRENWLNTRFIWKLLIDQGDTESLKEQVENTFGADTWTERQNLLDISPYVSKTVLEAVADNTVLFPHPVALDIFLANPDVLNDKLFIKYLEEKTDPMPEYMIDILMSVSNQTTVRTILEDEMRMTRMKYLDAAQKLMRFDLDTKDAQSRSDELKEFRTLPTTYMVIDDLLMGGQYTLADSILQNCVSYLGLGSSGRHDLAQYAVWLDWYQRLNEGIIDIDNIPSLILEEMEAFAENEGFTYAGMSAASLLNFFYEGQFVQEVYVPEVDPSTKRNTRRGPTSFSEISVFPSPANSLVNIQINLKDPRYIGGKLAIFSFEGKQLYSTSITDLNQQWAIQINDWPTGLYLVNVTSDKCAWIYEKLEIVK